MVITTSKKIKQKFIKKVRIPEIIKDLENITSNISSKLSNIEANKLDLFIEFKKCESILNNVFPKASSAIKSEIKSLLNDFQKRKRLCWKIFKCYQMDRLTEQDIYDSYAKISSIKEALIQEDKDLRYDNE
ncbi:hypothetical protein [Sulfurospirillum sp. hDNRA2]|uniref:hypothetical protein n=1 Tax=Sulfurospirillum sp. hDNRA2 TaxID=3237298 RepID=UPI0020B6558E|nr:hypothetical protein [Sulfurospirillum sp. DNRA8]MCP3652921.1 hypothetical protein [Sulfurospirillum sp. DNRA8]MCR1811773.1 hypothetical protein [Sulfurospirillum sp. DNRA8]